MDVAGRTRPWQKACNGFLSFRPALIAQRIAGRLFIRPPQTPLIRVEREIRDLEREIAFLDVLCRSYERCLPTSSDD